MKIKRFSDISKNKNSFLIKESLSKSLEEYCYELFDVGYTVLPEQGSFNFLVKADLNGRNYFILSGKGHHDDVQKFVDIIESMEPVKVSWAEDPDLGNTFILCMSKDSYDDLFKRFELYFKYVEMKIIGGKKHFYSNNKRNRVDPYDGVDFPKSECYIAYEINSSFSEKSLSCNIRDFWGVVRNKIRTSDNRFISLFIKAILFDIFDVEVSFPIARHVPHLNSYLDAGWQLPPEVGKE